MSESATICPDCHNAIPARAPAGLCPFCLASSVAEELDSRTPVEPIANEPVLHERIGPYLLRERLGEGGYGVVYRAEQKEPLRRTVAIKIMKAGVVSAQAVARFEAERQALAMMEHPGIAHVYDVGETPEGLPYFVMELIEGVPITTWCEERGLSRDERLRLFRQVCEAIAHAHRRGIIHRDLKPSNILVTGSDGAGVPKVIDFGIAKATETLLTERTLVTRDHQLVGTPAYMSPEQAAMRGGDIDTRSDIYSLGVVLYELLTGTTPFRIEELAELPYDEALRKVRTEDPQRPSSRCRDLTRSGAGRPMAAPDLPLAASGDLDWIVMKALAKEPERRYETADAFSRDVGRFLDGEAIEARPPTAGYLLGKFVRRHRVPVLAAAAVLFAMVAGTIVSLVMFFRAEEQATLAAQNEERAGLQARLASESEEGGRQLFSRADFALASSLLDEARPGVAVAHLVRALRSNPDNQAAASRLLFTLAAQNWARPVASLDVSHGPVLFTPDGTRLVGLTRFGTAPQAPQQLLVFDAASGERVQSLGLDGVPHSLDLSPDGRLAAIGFADGGVALCDLGANKVRWSKGREGGGLSALVKFGPEGRTMAATSWQHPAVRVWRVDDGADVLSFAVPGGGDGQWSALADLSPDGARVVGGFGNRIRVVDLTTGQPVGREMTHGGIVAGVAFLPDGERIVSWSHDATARVWNAATGEALLTMLHEKEVSAAAVSPDGSRLLTGTGNVLGRRSPGFSRMWDLDTGKPIGFAIEHPSEIQCVAFSPDGSKFATGCLVHRNGDGALRIFDGWTGEPLMAPIFHPRGAEAVAFSPDGLRIAVSSRHLETAVWDLRMGLFEPIRIAAGQPVWRAVFAADDRSVLTIGTGGSVRRWNAADGAPLSEPAETGPEAMAAWGGKRYPMRDGVQRRREHRVHELPGLLAPRFQEGDPRCAAASDDGERLIVGGADGRVRVWSLRDGDLWAGPFEPGLETGVTAVAIDAESRRVASGGADGSVSLWNLQDHERIATQEMHIGPVNQLTFSPDGASLASASKDGTARIWWIGASPALSEPLDNRTWVNYVSFSPDGRILASSGQDNAARLWEARTGEPLNPPLRHIDAATYGLFLLWPDSRRLVTTGSHDNTARLWDVETGRMLCRPMEQPTAALSAALRPDGAALVMGDDYDFNARVWDLATGEPLTPLLRHDERVLSVAFDSTGTRVVTGTRNGSAYLWDVPAPREPLPEEFLRFAEALGGFRLNPGGVLEQVASDDLAALHGESVQPLATGDDQLDAWMHWLVLPLDARTTSPHSAIPLQTCVERLVRRDHLDSLREALLLDPADPVVMGRYGYRLVTQPEPTLREVRYGGFLVRRAVQLAPDNAELKWMRALVVLQERIRGVNAPSP